MLSAAATFGPIYSRERKPQFFTSNLYPQIFDEELSLKGIEGGRGTLNSQPIDDFSQLHPHILSGTLVEVIRYPFYDHQPPEDFQQFTPSILSGSIQLGIVYKTYDHLPAEPFQQFNPSILSGAITTIPPIPQVSHEQFPEAYALVSAGVLSGLINNV
jgi:hypothetical protein